MNQMTFQHRILNYFQSTKCKINILMIVMTFTCRCFAKIQDPIIQRFYNKQSMERALFPPTTEISILLTFQIIPKYTYIYGQTISNEVLLSAEGLRML